MTTARQSDELQTVDARRVVFRGKGRVGLQRMALPAVGPRDVLVRTECSLVSSGTELTVLHRVFEPRTHWDVWVRYPFFPGYATVGVVVACGSDVTEFDEGAWVVCRTPHASHHVVDATQCARVPAHVAPEDASWFALAKIAFRAAQGAPFRLGDAIAVIGAGPIGQMAARWARVAGARSVIVIDPVAERLHFAEAVADVVVAVDSEDAAAALDDLGHERPEVVVDATGRSPALQGALRLAADRARVVLLGDSGMPSEQRLTGDVLTRGLHLIGVHDGHDAERWDFAAISSFFLDLVACGRFDVRDLITHRYRPDQAPTAYENLVADQAASMGVLFEWS